MVRIARDALEDARGYPATRPGARAFRARIVQVHDGQRRAAALYVAAFVHLGARLMQAGGRAYQEGNVTLLRAGFVGDYC
jgi:hypothetical protein